MDERVSAWDYRSPLGVLRLEAGARGLRAVSWRRPKATARARDDHPVLRRAVRALDRYFARRDTALDVPLDLAGLPPFRRRVLECLRARVAAGTVVTYGRLAELAGNARAARAVGAAMASNPLPIFVPCHRVVAANGPGGFGPGLARKRALLALEGIALEERGGGAPPGGRTT